MEEKLSERKLLVKSGDHPGAVRVGYIAVTEPSKSGFGTAFFHPSSLDNHFESEENQRDDRVIDALLGIAFISLGLESKAAALEKILAAGDQGIEVSVPKGFNIYSAIIDEAL